MTDSFLAANEFGLPSDETKTEIENTELSEDLTSDPWVLNKRFRDDLYLIYESGTGPESRRAPCRGAVRVVILGRDYWKGPLKKKMCWAVFTGNLLAFAMEATAEIKINTSTCYNDEFPSIELLVE